MTPTEQMTALYQRHYRSIFGLCYRMTNGNVSAAEELTHDTFLAAWRAWDRTPVVEASAGAWLRTIARNQVIDWFKRVAHRPVCVEWDTEWDNAGACAIDYASPDVVCLEDEAIRRILTTWRQLQPNHREILARRLAGQDLPQIARAMHLDYNATKQLLWRARRALARTLRS